MIICNINRAVMCVVCSGSVLLYESVIRMESTQLDDYQFAGISRSLACCVPHVVVVHIDHLLYSLLVSFRFRSLERVVSFQNKILFFCVIPGEKTTSVRRNVFCDEFL